ncbi:hypothetical protein MTO96_049818 [Rhipicephalus appendiculatus]
MSDVENESDDISHTKKKVLRQESKKKRSNRAASKKQQFDDVLRQHTMHALQCNSAVSSGTSPVKARVPDKCKSQTQRNRRVTPTAFQSAKKRKSDTPSTSESEDSLVPENEVRVARKEAKFWKAQYRLQCQHNATLKKEMAFLQDTVRAQLTSFKDMLEVMPRTRVNTGAAVASVEQQRGMATSETTSGCIQGQRTAAPLREAIFGNDQLLNADTTEIQRNCSQGGMSAAPAESHSLVEDVGAEVNEDHADGTHDNVAEFAPTSDGRFHLCKGIMINDEQATKIFSNKKATIVVRDCAQAIWGREALAHRTVSVVPCLANKLAAHPRESASCERMPGLLGQIEERRRECGCPWATTNSK